MDLPIAPRTVAPGTGDRFPTGTPGECSGGNPLATPPVLATPCTAAMMNTLFLEIRNCITSAGLTPNNADLTQLWQSILRVPGRLLGVYANGTGGTYSFTPAAGCGLAWVLALGGGGAGGATAATGPGQLAIGSPGGAGAVAGALWYEPTAQTLTVGAGGTPVTGAAGHNGGATSVGSLLIAPGGSGGYLGTVVSAPAYSTPSPGGAAPSFGTGMSKVYATNGWVGGVGLGLSATVVVSGKGADTPFGAGGAAVGGPNSGIDATGFGAGGGAAAATQSTGLLTGGAGRDGLIIIAQFSGP